MDFRGFSWIFMDFHRFCWIFIDFHGSSSIFHRLWSRMQPLWSRMQPLWARMQPCGAGLLGGWLPLSFSIALIGLEILVAFLQAYVFAILTCIYLNDALNLHH